MQHSLKSVLDAALSQGSRVIMKTAGMTVELRGEDLTVKETDRFVTIFHRTAPNSEARSHVHIRVNHYRRAVLRHPEGKTMPFLSLYPSADDEVVAGEADLKVYFPPLFDRKTGAPFPANQQNLEQWVQRFGDDLELRLKLR